MAASALRSAYFTRSGEGYVQKHFSLLWDITTGQVTIAQGVMPIDQMRTVGKTFEDFVRDLDHSR